MNSDAPNVTNTIENRLERARRVYREYFTLCFWHWRPDLDVTEAMIPAIIKGLRANGNRQAFVEAEHLSRVE